MALVVESFFSRSTGNRPRADGTRTLIKALVAAVVLATPLALSALQTPAVRSTDQTDLGQYTGVYRWDQRSFLYVQIWSELAGTNQLVAFDESGDVRALYLDGS